MTTPHGVVQTPAFMPVGTQGAVKAMLPRDLIEVGAEIILANTYHLYLRPGDERIARHGGLHRFIGWDRPILTDSGGYQAFSLGERRTIDERGITLPVAPRRQRAPAHAREGHRHPGQSRLGHRDGAGRMPRLPGHPGRGGGVDGADAPLGGPLPPAVPGTAGGGGGGRRQAAGRRRRREPEPRAEAVRVTNPGQAQFGIVQGGTYRDIRVASAQATVELGFEAYAIGGLSVGEPPDLMYEIVGETTPFLPEDRPRYLMGTGTPVDLVEAVALRRGPVRLRDADPQRPKRPALHQRRAPEHQERPVRGRPRAGRSALRLLHLPALLKGLPSPPVRGRRNRRGHPQHAAQPDVLP